MPELAIKLVETLTARLREAEARLRELAYERVERGLLYLLLRLAEQFGRRRGELVCLEIRLTHEELAAMIGSTRETVIATLSGLARRGVLRSGRRDLCLHLARVVQDPELGTLCLQSPDDGPSTSRYRHRNPPQGFPVWQDPRLGEGCLPGSETTPHGERARSSYRRIGRHLGSGCTRPRGPPPLPVGMLAQAETARH